MKLPAEVFKRVGRLISDGEASKPGQSTSKDLPHTVRQKRMPECDLLVMTGGTHTSDRASHWPKLEEWQRNLAFTVVDEAQQFGTDREVTAIAMLPPASFILWTGDAQQTPGGIAKGDNQYARSRQQLMSRRHALRCPQTELTPHKLHTALLTHLADVDLLCVADFRAMFEVADANPGPIWVPDVEPHHMRARQQLQHLYPDQELSWRDPTTDEHQNHPMSDGSQLFASNINPSSIICFAYICLSLETNPEWLPAIQARSNVDTAGSEGAFAWGLLLPTSTRTAGVTYTSIVGVRYDMLCELLDGKWKIGTHTLGGVDGLVGGFQFVHWYRPQKYYQYSRNCDLRAVIEPLLQRLRATHPEGSLLIMSASNDDRDSMRKWDLAQDDLIAINSVASSAGSTATMAVVVQSATDSCGYPITKLNSRSVATRHDGYNGHDSSLGSESAPHRGSLSNQFQLDHARTGCWRDAARAIRKRNCIPETGSCRILARANGAPPCNLFMETKVGGGSADMRPVRLRLVIVHAAEVRGAEDWLGPLTQLRGTNKPFPWMPRQNTESMMLWAYAADGDSRPLLWLGPKSTDDTSAMVLRHWLMNKVVPTFPLPGIFFFDAWRIHPSLKIPLQLSVGLTAVDLTHDEEMPQAPEAHARYSSC